MGADLIFTYLATSGDIDEINWDAARDWVAENPKLLLKRLEKLDQAYLDYWDLEDENGNLVVGAEQEIINQVQHFIEIMRDSFGWRTSGYFTFGNITFIILGELSWGESPEGFDEWTHVQNLAPEALQAAGFLEGLQGGVFSTGTPPECGECGKSRYYTPCEFCDAKEGNPWR